MVFLRWEIFTSNLGFFFHTKFHTKLRDSKHLLSDTLLYVFPVKNFQVSHQDFRFFIPPKWSNLQDFLTALIYYVTHGGFFIQTHNMAENNGKRKPIPGGSDVGHNNVVQQQKIIFICTLPPPKGLIFITELKWRLAITCFKFALCKNGKATQ